MKEVTKDSIEYPVRINRYLFLKNVCSRRQADKLIERGLVKVNDKKAVLGQKVLEGDVVEVSNSVKKMVENYKYIIFNKARGIVSHDPQGDEKSVEDVLKFKEKLAPVGRLDKESEGLMLLTNDGRIVNKILDPKFGHEREYKVTVDKELKPSFEKKMERGVDIEGYVTKPAKVKILGPNSFSIILTEGKKHQIRRMCMNLGYTVKRLVRTRMMHIKLGSLTKNTWRELSKKEKERLLRDLKMN